MTTMTSEQLEELKDIHATLKESSIENSESAVWGAILKLGWLIDDLSGVGVKKWRTR